MTSDPAALNLYKKKYVTPKKLSSWPNATEGISRVKKGGYALFIDTATAYKMIEVPYKCKKLSR